MGAPNEPLSQELSARLSQDFVDEAVRAYIQSLKPQLAKRRPGRPSLPKGQNKDSLRNYVISRMAAAPGTEEWTTRDLIALAKKLERVRGARFWAFYGLSLNGRRLFSVSSMETIEQSISRGRRTAGKSKATTRLAKKPS